MAGGQSPLSSSFLSITKLLQVETPDKKILLSVIVYKGCHCEGRVVLFVFLKDLN